MIEAEVEEIDEAASELAGVLIAVAQGLAPTETPVNFAEAELLATGQVVPNALNGITPELGSNPTAPPTRSNPLFRQFVSDASPRNNTQLTPPVTQDTTPTQPAPAAPVVQQTVAPEVPTALPAPTDLATAVAAVQPAQRQVVPPQVPLVAGLLPNALPVNADDLPDPIVAPQAVVAPAALPSAAVGDRPTTAGEQFAEIASAAQTIAPSPTPPAPAAPSFAATVTAVLDAPAPAPAPAPTVLDVPAPATVQTLTPPPAPSRCPRPPRRPHLPRRPSRLR